MAFNEQEQAIINAGKAQGKSVDDVKRALAKYRAQQPVTKPEPQQGFFRDALTDIQEAFGGAVSAVSGGIEESGDIRERVTTGETTPVAGTLQTLGAGLQAGANVIGEGVLGVGKAVLPQAAEEAIGEKVTQGVQNIVQTEPVQQLIQGYENLSPEQKRNVNAVLGITEAGSTLLGAAPAARTARQAISRTGEAVADVGTEVADRIRVGTGNLAERVTPQVIKDFNQRLSPENREQAIEGLTETYRSTLVENRKSVNDRLERIAASASTADTPVTRDQLLRNLAEEGYKPDIEDRLAKFTSVFEDIAEKQRAAVEQIDPILENVAETTTLETLRSAAEQILRSSPQVGAGFNRSLAELDRYIDSYRNKYGENLTPKQVNEIRKEMNRVTRAYKNDDIFLLDTADAVGKATRQRIDEIVPTGEVRAANQEWARLQRLRETAEVLHNQQVDVGILGRALGSYASTIAASGIGLGVGGPGGLVIAGLVAHYGGDMFADMLRKKLFSDEITDVILQNVKQDPELVNKLIREASPENKAYLRNLLIGGAAAGTALYFADKNPEAAAALLVGSTGKVPVTGKGLDRIEEYVDWASGAKKLKGQELIDLKADAQIIAERLGLDATGSDKQLANQLRMKLDEVSFNQSATTKTTDLLEEARKYKSAEEFVEAQGTPVYHGTTKKAAESIKKTGFREGKEASELGKGVYVTSDKTPAALFGNRGEVIEAYVPNLKTYELPDFKLNPEVESSKLANNIINRGTLPETLKGMNVGELAERIKETWSTDDARFWLEKAGYDGITDATSQIKGQTVIFDPSKIKTRTQIEDIWKQANAL